MPLKEGTAADAPSIDGKAGWAVSTNGKGARGHRLCKGGGSPEQRGAASQQGWGCRERRGLRQQKSGLISRRNSDGKGANSSSRGGVQATEDGTWQQRKGCRQQSVGVSVCREGAHAAEGLRQQGSSGCSRGGSGCTGG